MPIFKVYESLILKQLNRFLYINLLTGSQFAFRTGKSNTMAVSCIIYSIIDAFEDKENYQWFFKI